MPKKSQNKLKQKQKQKQSVSVVIHNNSAKSKRSRKSSTKSSGSSGGSSFYQQMPSIIIQPAPQQMPINNQQPNVIHYNAQIPNRVSSQNDISRNLTQQNLSMSQQSDIFMTPMSRQTTRQEEFIYSPIVGRVPSILNDIDSINTEPINNMDDTFTAIKPNGLSPPKSNRKKNKPRPLSTDSSISTGLNNLGNLGRNVQNTGTPMQIPMRPPALDPYLHNSRPNFLNTEERSEMKFRENLAQTGFDINPLRGNQVNDDILSETLPRPPGVYAGNNAPMNDTYDANISMIPTVGSPAKKNRGRPRGSKNNTPKKQNN